MAVCDKGLHSVVAVCVQYPDAGIQQCHVRVYVCKGYVWMEGRLLHNVPVCVR